MNSNNQFTIAVILSLLLSTSSEIKLPHSVKPICKAYTNWNIIMFTFRHLFNMYSWDPFLYLNSVAIFVGFHTAFANGLTKNLRKKLNKHGLLVNDTQFAIGDHIVHTLPMIVCTYKVIKNKNVITWTPVMCTLTYGALFSYSQNGTLNASKTYVPHPWKRTWGAMFLGILSAKSAVNSYHKKQYKKSLLTGLTILLPFILSKFDKGMKNKYTFEYLCRKNSDKNLQLKKSRTTIF